MKRCLLMICFLAALGTSAWAGDERVNGQAEFMKMKYGFFVHYVWGGAYTVTVNRDVSEQGDGPMGSQPYCQARCDCYFDQGLRRGTSKSFCTPIRVTATTLPRRSRPNSTCVLLT